VTKYFSLFASYRSTTELAPLDPYWIIKMACHQ